jgi:NAD-dependent DNA ligase
VLHPGELYELTQGDWDQLEGVSVGQLTEIQGQMQSSKSAEQSALLFGLRLPGVDTNLAKRLIGMFGSIDKLRETKPGQLQQAGELSEQQAVEIRRWFSDSVNRKALQMLEQNGFRFSG